MSMNRKPMAVFLFVLVLLVSCSDEPFSSEYERGRYNLWLEGEELVSDVAWVVNLQKDEGDFVILNLTDIQLGTTAYVLDFGEVSDNISKMVEKYDPDLITFTGDMSYGCSTAVYGICSFLDSFGIPWAPVFGNHDHENSGMSPDTYAKVLENFSNCLFRSGPEHLVYEQRNGVEGKGNYVINIYEKDSTSFGIFKSLIMMNSGTSGINPQQVQWYEDCIDSVNQYSDGSAVSSAVFMHIPIHGYRLAAENAFAKAYWTVTLEESYSFSSAVWKSGYEDSFGVCHESSGPSRNEGLTDLIFSMDSTDLVVCGHNHANCACIKYNDVRFVFGLKTGPGCYYEEGLDGGTVITISEDGSNVVEHCFVDDL